MKRGIRLGVAALAGAVGLLSLLNYGLVQNPIDISPVAPPTGEADAPRPDSAPLVTALDKRAAEQFQETVGRPLFNPTRRPVERLKAAAAEPKAEAIELRLIGIMKPAKDPPRALLRSGNEPTGKWIAEGAEIDGWTLRKIDERSVILQSGNRSRELKLFFPRRPPDEPPGPKR